MKYVFVSGNNKKFELSQATNMSEAIKEALVYKIIDRWGFRLISLPIDFNNFDTWLINWLKSTNFWEIPAINSNVEKNKDFYGNLRENIVENLNLFDYGSRNAIYEISEERNIDYDLVVMKNDIVGEAVLQEINKIQEEKEKKEYARLKKKFETA